MKHLALLTIFLVYPLAVEAKDPRRIRVYVNESVSWSVGENLDDGGGSRPQTVEVIKTFRDKCPELTITITREKADYGILFDREAKDTWQKDNKIAVFNRDGDVIYTGSTRALGNAVKDACQAIWKEERMANRHLP